MARNAILPGLLILAAAVVACGLLGKSLKKVAVPEEKPAAVAEPEPTVPEKFLKFFKDVHYSGAVGASGWSGTGVYKCPAGHTLKVGVKGSGKVECVDTTLTYASKSALPSVELSASGLPGDKLTYGAKLTKGIKKCPACPELYAGLTPSGVTLGTSMTQKVTDDLDLKMKLDVPYTYASGAADPSVSADATYKVAGGKVVGTFLAKASGGIKGSKVSATYDLR